MYKYTYVYDTYMHVHKYIIHTHTARIDILYYTRIHVHTTINVYFKAVTATARERGPIIAKHCANNKLGVSM